MTITTGTIIREATRGTRTTFPPTPSSTRNAKTSFRGAMTWPKMRTQRPFLGWNTLSFIASARATAVALAILITANTSCRSKTTWLQPPNKVVKRLRISVKDVRRHATMADTAMSPASPIAKCTRISTRMATSTPVNTSSASRLTHDIANKFS